MELYLMQHGEALSEQEDPQRPLSPAGIAQVKAAGRGMRHLGLGFDLIVASPKRRAQQAAALIAEAVRFPYSDILSTEAVLPQAEPAALQAILEPEAVGSRVLVVGHLPHLAGLAAHLLGGGRLAFENAGLACLSLSAEQPELKFLLTNAQLARIGS